MINWKKVAVYKNQTLKEVMELLDKSALRVIIVVDESNYLLGVVTDGDIRRGLLRGVQLSDYISNVMNTNPFTVQNDLSRENVRNLLFQKKLLAIPIVDKKNHVLGIETIDTVNEFTVNPCDVILMAGGFGTRLHPLTRNMPKPMLQIGNKPLLESIIDNFIAQGFTRFYISTHFKAELISNYFKDGSSMGCQISYLEEQKPLGTAGALSLLPEDVSDNFIVMNADIITKINLQNLLNFHVSHNSLATMCVRQVEYNMPYGVVDVEYPSLKRIKEKPIYQHFINAGIYAFSKEVKPEIPNNQFLDMPTLYESLIEKNKNVIAFPIYEYWMDIGRHEDFQKMLETESL